jgi:hypothetical protein
MGDTARERQQRALHSAMATEEINRYSFRELVAVANARLSKTWALHSATWNFGHEISYRLDPARGCIVFNFEGGAQVTAPAQLIGTYTRSTSSFLWAWADPAFTGSALAAVSVSLRRFGARRRWEPMTSPTVECSQHIAWAFNSLSFLLTRADGAFEEAVDDDVFRYIIFSSPSITHGTGSEQEQVSD